MEHFRYTEEWFLTALSIRATGWAPLNGIPAWLEQRAEAASSNFDPFVQLQLLMSGIKPKDVLLDELTRLRDHVDRERGACLEGRAMVLTKSQLDLAELWLKSLRDDGRLTGMMDKVMALGIPTDLNEAEKIADARGLLSDAWGVVNDGHWDAIKSETEHKHRALHALVLTVHLLSKDDPELPIRLLWAIVLSFLIGEHRENDAESRLHHVNHTLSRESFPGQLLPDPIGGDFDFETDGEIQGKFFRRDTFINNLQVNKEVSLGRTRADRAKAKDTDLGKIMWGKDRKPVRVPNHLRALGLTGVWIPNNKKEWCSWKPVGLLRKALMSMLRKLAVEAKNVIESGGYNVCLTQYHMRLGKCDLKFKHNPRAPFRLTIPIDTLFEEAYHLRYPENHRFTPLRGAYRNPTLVEDWKVAKSLRRGPGAEAQLASFDDEVKCLPNGLTPKQAMAAARKRNHMRLRGAILGASKLNLTCKSNCCRPLVKMWRQLNTRPLFVKDMKRIKDDVAAGLLLTHREFVRWLWMLQNQRLHTGLTSNGTHVIEVAVFGDIKDTFRGLIGLPGGDPHTDKASRDNGRRPPRSSKAQLAQLASNVPSSV